MYAWAADFDSAIERIGFTAAAARLLHALRMRCARVRDEVGEIP